MLKFLLTLIAGVTLSTSAFADKLDGDVAIHIAKRHYEHPVRLLHPYLDVWHMKGPLAEKVALKTFAQAFTNSHLCNETNANVTVLLEPQMFYNAQLRVFHAEIIAKAFTTGSEPIVTIKKQAEQNGELGIKPEFYMEKAYTKAMDKVLKKLTKDATFLDALKTNQANQSTQAQCILLDSLPVSKIYY
jgi:hypothetical protein